MKNLPKIIAGIDDATKCPCIGSIFVSGVVADQKTLKDWKKIGVKDSKLIAAKKRERLAEVIERTALACSINQITPKRIDNKSLNLNDWEMVAVFEIIDDLLKKSEFEQVYIDNWEVNNERFEKRVKFFMQTDYATDLLRQSLGSGLDLIAEHKADEKYTIVGAASILSKVYSDRQYADYKKIYGDFGSGSPADPRTRKFVWQHRKKPAPIIRQSWRTYKVLSKLKKLDEDPIYSGNKAKKRYSK